MGNGINLIEKRKNFFFTIKYWRNSPILKTSKENYLRVKVQTERTAERIRTQYNNKQVHKVQNAAWKLHYIQGGKNNGSTAQSYSNEC